MYNIGTPPPVFSIVKDILTTEKGKTDLAGYIIPGSI